MSQTRLSQASLSQGSFSEGSPSTPKKKSKKALGEIGKSESNFSASTTTIGGTKKKGKKRDSGIAAANASPASPTVVLAQPWMKPAIEDRPNLPANTKIPAPKITPAGGAVDRETLIKLTCDLPAAHIYYTTNGIKPTSNSTHYHVRGPFAIKQSCTVKAIAVVRGVAQSPVTEVTFKV